MLQIVWEGERNFWIISPSAPTGLTVVRTDKQNNVFGATLLLDTRIVGFVIIPYNSGLFW